MVPTPPSLVHRTVVLNCGGCIWRCMEYDYECMCVWCVGGCVALLFSSLRFSSRRRPSPRSAHLVAARAVATSLDRRHLALPASSSHIGPGRRHLALPTPPSRRPSPPRIGRIAVAEAATTTARHRHSSLLVSARRLARPAPPPQKLLPSRSAHHATAQVARLKDAVQNSGRYNLYSFDE